MLGKAKCKILKEIRQKIADANDIPYVTRECTYQGDCSGTCPRCESELRYLERELEARQRRGKALAVTALCAGLVLGGTGCTPSDNAPTLAGDLPRIEDITDTVPEDDAPSTGADGGIIRTAAAPENEVLPIDDLAPEDVAAALPEDDAPSTGVEPDTSGGKMIEVQFSARYELGLVYPVRHGPANPTITFSVAPEDVCTPAQWDFWSPKYELMGLPVEP